MGMFDYLRCEYPLPTRPELQTVLFQTKSLECLMDEYTITSDGRLIHHTVEWEVVPEEERPYFGKPEWESGNTLWSLVGSMKAVPAGEIEVPMHGDLQFHHWIEEEQVVVDFIARFTEGRLSRIWEVKR